MARKKRLSVTYTLFLILAAAVVGYNTFKLGQYLLNLKRVRQVKPYIFLGFKFSGLKDILGDVTAIGYYTDKDLDKNEHARQFAQAQYILAPIILDLNDTEHPFVLFDCSTQEVAMAKIKEFRLSPVRKNQFGVILTKNPRIPAR